MAKLGTKREPRRITTISPRRPGREIAIDDIIKDLLDLFEHLGLNASKLAARVTNVDPATLASRQLHPYASAIGALLTAWHQNPEYIDDLGNPAPIKMRRGRRSFRSLSEKTVPNIEPSSLLSELEGIGAVTLDSDGFIHVHMRSLPVYEDKKLAIQHTLASLHSFIGTLRHNLISAPSNSDQLFHRVAWNGEIDNREIPALKIKVKRHGQNFLESCDNWMARRTKSDTGKSKTKGKTSQAFIGVYLAVDLN